MSTYSGKTISTPTPAITLLIRKVVLMPALWREMTIPLSRDTLRLFSGTSCRRSKAERLDSYICKNQKNKKNKKRKTEIWRQPLGWVNGQYDIEVRSMEIIKLELDCIRWSKKNREESYSQLWAEWHPLVEYQEWPSLHWQPSTHPLGDSENTSFVIIKGYQDSSMRCIKALSEQLVATKKKNTSVCNECVK